MPEPTGKVVVLAALPAEGAQPRALEVNSIDCLLVCSIPTPLDQTIQNLDMPVANQEYSTEIPEGTQLLVVQCRQLSAVQIAFAPFATSPPFFTLKSTRTLALAAPNCVSGTLYARSSIANRTLELITWSCGLAP